MANSLTGKKFLQKTFANIVLGIICFMWTVPTFGLFVTSFRHKDDVAKTGWWTALDKENKGFTFINYRQVLAAGREGVVNEAGRKIRGKNFFTAFTNSITVTIPATVIPILIATFASYGFAWIRFPGRRFFFSIVVALLVVPLQIALIPLLVFYNKIEIGGTFLAIWLAHTGFGLPLAIYLIFNYINQLPRSILESAFIDGASHFTCFIRLILPLSVPVLASFAIFQFLWVWNDLFVALVFLGTDSEMAVLTSQLLNLIGERGSNWHLLCSGAFISMVIPLVVFFSLQKYFVRGLLAGSVKE
ncbi:MAG: carbohydrate ABC transporter permease [Spirochaetes bacterium]|nr:carbohydrate ABC transporter permease [Spirochaetota bacterium]